MFVDIVNMSNIFYSNISTLTLIDCVCVCAIVFIINKRKKCIMINRLAISSKTSMNISTCHSVTPKVMKTKSKFKKKLSGLLLTVTCEHCQECGHVIWFCVCNDLFVKIDMSLIFKRADSLL